MTYPNDTKYERWNDKRSAQDSQASWPTLQLALRVGSCLRSKKIFRFDTSRGHHMQMFMRRSKGRVAKTGRQKDVNLFKHVWQLKTSLTFEGTFTGCRDWVVQNNPPLSTVTQAQAVTRAIIQLSFLLVSGKMERLVETSMLTGSHEIC